MGDSLSHLDDLLVLTKSIVVFEDKKGIIQSGATEYQGFSDSLAF